MGNHAQCQRERESGGGGQGEREKARQPDSCEQPTKAPRRYQASVCAAYVACGMRNAACCCQLTHEQRNCIWPKLKPQSTKVSAPEPKQESQQSHESESESQP